MIYTEKIADLFQMPNDYYLAHCISADFGMGRGIVVEFNKRFNMKQKLQKNFPDYVNEWHKYEYQGACILMDSVLNLITKERYYDKPTYKSIESALYNMRDVCFANNIKKVAMPTIGCGLDRLEWPRVRQIIQKIFEDTDIEIVVCRKE